MSEEFDQDDAMLELLVFQGYLEKQVLPNGKIYYKRTSKPIPDATDAGRS
jgi:hypothetical protein